MVSGGGSTSGNTVKGKAKRKAGGIGGVLVKGKAKRKAGARGGQRSGMRRAARVALVVKRPWIDYLLEGTKTWEIRGTKTTKRGGIHLAESGTGTLVGGASLVTFIFVTRDSFKKNRYVHRVPSVSYVKYPNMYAWIFENPRRYETPFDYHHTPGAVIFVHT